MAAKEIEDKEQYIELIKLLVPINSLSPQLQNEVINIARLFRYKKKDFVFKEGDRDDYSFYLLEGEIELLSGKSVQSTLAGGAESAMYAMSRLQPRQYSAKCKTEAVIMQINRSALDRLMVAEESKTSEITGMGGIEVEEASVATDESGDWMTKMLQSELFCRLPTANIHQLFALLEPVDYKRGDVIINQGDPGEHYYIIQEGKCEVTRTPSAGARPIKLAELQAGDSFGEEALLTNATRNATIKMLSHGVLMQLSKDNFINLIKKPTLEEVSFSSAMDIIKSGGKWLDVRFPNEHEESHIGDSQNIPLNMLRMQTDKLDQSKKYVVYCDTGGRSSAAAFLLTDRGFNVCFLSDGLASVPAEHIKTTSPAPPPLAPKAQEKAAAKAQAVAMQKAAKEEEELEASIRESVIDVDLERTNIDLKEAIKKAMEEEDTGKEEAKAAQVKLEADKKKLEADKEAAQKAAQKMREQEEERIRKLKDEAEKRLADEKKKLEEIYARNAQEMEKLERMKQEAEEQIKKEREKLEREAEEARKKNIEADKLKKQLEESRLALEKEAEKKRAEQLAMEKSIQAKAKAKLEEERKKLAEEVARTSEEMEKAQKARAMADAAKAAAENEAKKIISEYKKQFDQERAVEQARLQEMRKKLEEESAKIQSTLKDIQKTRQEAETARLEAEAEANRLRKKQSQEDVTLDRATREQVEEEIKAVEAKLQEAQKNLETVAEAEVSIAAVKEVNEQELVRQKQEEEELKKQVEADLAQFKKEEVVKEEQMGRDKVVAHADHIKRIKERAAAAKRAAENANTSLMDDVASQLGKNN